MTQLRFVIAVLVKPDPDRALPSVSFPDTRTRTYPPVLQELFTARTPKSPKCASYPFSTYQIFIQDPHLGQECVRVYFASSLHTPEVVPDVDIKIIVIIHAFAHVVINALLTPDTTLSPASPRVLSPLYTLNILV